MTLSTPTNQNKPPPDQALRGAPGLCFQHQIVAHGRDGHFVVVVAFVAAGQQAPQGQAVGNGLAGQQLATAVLQCHGIFGQDLGRDAVAQQPFHGVFGQDDTVETALVVAEGRVQLQHCIGHVAVVFAVNAPVNGLHQIARQTEVVFGFAQLEHSARPQALGGQNAGDTLVGHNPPPVIDPSQADQFGILLHHAFGAGQELFDTNLFVRDIAGQAHDLFLALQQS